MASKVCVIGLGNMLMQDDAVGLRVAEALKETCRFEPPIDLVDGGTAGLDLLPLIEGYEMVLFVDAIDAGEPPGTVVTAEGDAVPSVLTACSAHHAGLSDLLFAARLSGHLPAHVCLVGIQPESVDIGLCLTETIKKRLDLLSATVLERLQEWGVKMSARNSSGHSSSQDM
jgi:hydrogenase maturation protease